MQYRTVWVHQPLIFGNGNTVIDCTNVDTEVARWSDDGWTLHSIVPGTNAQTYSGLFVTFQRD